MKYKYWFNGESTEIEVDPEWAEILLKLDKEERNNYFSEKLKSIHYEAFGFEPDFMGKEESEIAAIFDGTPAYDYAVQQIPSREMDILRRRALDGEPYPSIAKSYGMSATGVSDIYKAYGPRFLKYYEDGKWICSPENTPLPGNGKVLRITARLTPQQIQEIRRLRFEFHTLTEIADILGIACNRVLVCLMENPVDTTFCPTCGKPIRQSFRHTMRVFCSHKCYAKNYLKTGADGESKIARVKVRVFPDQRQQRLLRFYKQAFVPYRRMNKLIGIPFRTVQSFFNASPLPYCVCLCCGKKIPGSDNSNRIFRFCSWKCRNKYMREHPGAASFVNEDYYPGGVLPTPEALYMAMDLRREGYPEHTISVLTGLSANELAALFRYDTIDSNEELPGSLDGKMIPKVITRMVTIVNAYVFEPAFPEEPVPLYIATIIIPKEDRKTIEGIKTVLESILSGGSRKGGGLFFNRSRVCMPLHDGDAGPAHPVFKNNWYINAAAVTRPQIVDHKLYPVDDEEEFGSGCLARASLTFFPYRVNQKRYGIGCRLGNLQKVPGQEPRSDLRQVCFDEFAEEFKLVNLAGDGPG